MVDPFLSTPTVVATSPLPAYSVTRRTLIAPGGPLTTGTGIGQTLTATSNGALPAIDGVTLGAGGTLLLTAGAFPQDNQLYGVVSPGSASTPWVLQSAPWVFTQRSIVPATGGTPDPGLLYLDSLLPQSLQRPPFVGTNVVAAMPRYQTGSQVTIQQGTAYAGTAWELVTPAPIVAGTTGLSWVQT